MQNAVEGATHGGIQNVPLIAPARRPIKASDSNRTVKSECLVFHQKTTGQTEPRERLTNWKKETKKRGISDENDNEIQGSHSSIANDPLRRPRGNFSGGMCRESVCVQQRLLSERILQRILVL